MKLTFETVLTEVEAVINSRPLVYVASNKQSISDNIITPGNFLNFHEKTGLLLNTPDEYKLEDDLDAEQISTSTNLIEQWRKFHTALDSFWKIWQDEWVLNKFKRKKPKLCKTKKG